MGSIRGTSDKMFEMMKQGHCQPKHRQRAIVSQFLTELGDLGMAHNTIVIFTGDNCGDIGLKSYVLLRYAGEENCQKSDLG
jgi:3-mercaptopyruvate sulfurtransferase SseA